MNELEIIQHPLIQGLSIFFDTMTYRTSHIHSEWELVWVVNGTLCFNCGRGTFSLSSGEIALFAPNEPHEFLRGDSPSTFLCLQISQKLLPALPRILPETCLPLQHLSDKEANELRQRILCAAAAYFRRDVSYSLYCVGQSCLILHLLLSRLPVQVLSAQEAAADDRKSERLKRLIRFVDENYRDKIRLTDFAAQEGCSVSYLSHFIKEALNQSFQEYVSSIRFHRACELIEEGERHMLDVCLESGFSDYRYFSRAFRQQFHMTPEAYSRIAHQQPPRQEVRRSRHSVERFHTEEESLILLQQMEQAISKQDDSKFV